MNAICRLGLVLAVIQVTGTAGEGKLVTARFGSPPVAGKATKAGGGKAKPTGYAVEGAKPPAIDGAPNEEAWSKAPPLFLGHTLKGDGPARQKTEVRLLRDAEKLYIGIRCKEPFLGKLEPLAKKHDVGMWNGDSVEVFFGPADRGVYFHFGVGWTGGTYDGKGKDSKWNGGMKAAAQKGKGEWTAEISIPLAEVSGGKEIPKRWIANFNRSRFPGGGLEEYAWSPTLSGQSHVPNRFGTILFQDPPAGAAKPAAKEEKGAVKILRSTTGLGVARFDLSSIPKNARIRRADLCIHRTDPVDGRYPEALVDVEVFALVRAFKEGEKATPEGKPLAIKGPWYRSLDATEAVQAWVNGKANGGFFFKACPYWNKEATYLDVAWVGEPKPAAPQVSGLKVFHRSGQTFITWKEIEDLVKKDEVLWKELRAVRNGMDRERQVRYSIYRSAQSIRADTLAKAVRIAVVAPLSGWNINGRTKARGIDRFIATTEVLNWHQWNPFRGASVDGDYGRDCPMDRFVIEGKTPLPRTNGLYVHTATDKEKAYYAVVTRVNGIENTAEFGAANALATPVNEAVAEPEPVLQKQMPEMPFFNFKDKRLHYVRWVAPPYTNKPYDYYNWSVAVPLVVEKGATKDVPLELNLHRDGYGYWRTHYRNDYDSIVLCPHDFPLKTWWYGYHENFGTLKSWKGGTVRNYTEKRLLWFVKWAAAKWPVDRNRVLVTGNAGGASGSGALHLGLRNPELFNLIIAGHPFPTYHQLGKTMSQVERLWGKLEWGMKCESGKKVWDELNLLQYTEASKPTTDLPFVTMTYRTNVKACGQFEALMSKLGRPIVTHNAWGGGRYITVSPESTFVSGLRLDIRKNLPMLSFSSGGESRSGVRNGSYYWNRKDVVEEPGQLTVTFSQDGVGGTLTIRRLQKLKVSQGQAFSYTFTPVKITARLKTPAKPVNGEVTIGQDGLLRIPGVKLHRGTYRLVVKAK